MNARDSSVRSRAGYLVKQLQQALRARMDDALQALELSTAQYAILSAIEEQPRSSGADLARRCFITPQSVNGLLSGLEKRGFIERTASKTHGRIIETALTKTGHVRLIGAHDVVAGIEAKMLQDLDNTERRQLAALLARAIEGITR
jgi:DNA-binding MarR family transcriptional regulator